jgi:transcriptional regulator with XRE-family HTH domain
MQKIYRSIGARIRFLRLALKMTQAEVAEKVGIDSSFYGQLERGAGVPSLRTLFSIAAALRVDPAELLPKANPRPGKDLLVTEAIDTMISKLKPAKRRFLMSMVRDLADEFER